MKTQAEIVRSSFTDRDRLCINAIRALAMDAVEAANSGHPGAPMGMAPMAYVLWTRFLRHDPTDPQWPDRDRFILSAGHASMLLYSLLHLTGYPVTIDDIKSFRRFGSLTPGHPEHGHTPGVETTTGPLGQGFANGVGMAMAERYLAQRFNRPDAALFGHRTFGIVSDGDLMEGVSSEAASLAGHLQLGSLIYLYDSNRITIDGPTDLSFSEAVARRFDAYRWHTSTVTDGNDCDAIEAAIAAAVSDPRPSLIVVRTTIGFGAPAKQGTSAAHGAPLGEDEVAAARETLGWPFPPFEVPQEVMEHMQVRGSLERARWDETRQSHRTAHPQDAKELDRILSGDLPEGWEADLPRFSPEDGAIATRKASGVAIGAVAKHLPELIGGSADLAESNNTDVPGSPFFDSTTSGQNVHYGVREHAMGSAMNGMSLHGGVRPFGATFLVFSDYMRPAIRLAALMSLNNIYVFTHDSIGLGEDGPTHQPIEHLASLRAMPNLVVIRPGDANETIAAWRYALQYRGGPVALCLTRQGLPVLHATSGRMPPVDKGGYVLTDCIGSSPDVILIATGSELHLAHQAAVGLSEEDIKVRVVSMPSWEIFEMQSNQYQGSVLPSSVKARVAVEAGATFGWCRFTGDEGEVIGIDRFGASAPGAVVMKELGLTVDAIKAAAIRVVNRAAQP